ncbi:hypothetical protein CF77_gp44 [Oenococcus phage phi9805]|uniref:Uncharacterized protein n=1 Tax=Oenococcus phage phi9805 TaxID=1435411 RepID=V9QKW1_9CAUD|nr:hypothetical protein [Oenococcus oeni]YP_009005167.1 hypothetical protein CF77_gp44 [Oenococcus phage phi9805]AHC30321.1 hypothetical protein [Oenococcus phage phi9805]
MTRRKEIEKLETQIRGYKFDLQFAKKNRKQTDYLNGLISSLEYKCDLLKGKQT